MNIHRYIRRKLHIREADDLPYCGWRKDVTRQTLAEIFADLGFTYGAEIGVNKGANALTLFRNVPNLKLIAVDPYAPYGRISQSRQDSYKQMAIRNLKGCDIEWKEKTSIEAAKDIEDQSLDFVYIDGLHDFDNVIIDIIAWQPKVKKKGIISGHDYTIQARGGVIRAVDAYTFAHGIRNLYLIKTQYGNKNAVRADMYPSWFFVNEH